MPDRVAARDVGAAPQPRPPMRGSTCQLKRKAATAMSAACGQRQEAQQEGEAHARDVDDLPRELAPAEAQAPPPASTWPVARSQRHGLAQALGERAAR